MKNNTIGAIMTYKEMTFKDYLKEESPKIAAILITDYQMVLRAGIGQRFVDLNHPPIVNQIFNEMNLRGDPADYEMIMIYLANDEINITSFLDEISNEQYCSIDGLLHDLEEVDCGKKYHLIFDCHDATTEQIRQSLKSKVKPIKRNYGERIIDRSKEEPNGQMPGFKDIDTDDDEHFI